MFKYAIALGYLHRQSCEYILLEKNIVTLIRGDISFLYIRYARHVKSEWIQI